MPFMPKTKLSCCDQSNRVPSVTKTKQDNDVINCTSATHSKNDTEPSWPIRLGANCDENQIGKLRDRLYRCGLCQKWNWVAVTDRTVFSLWCKPDKTIMWLIIWFWFTPKSKVNYQDLFDWVRSVIKLDRIMTWSIVQVLSSSKMILICCDWSDRL